MEGKYFFPTQEQAERLTEFYQSRGLDIPAHISHGRAPASIVHRAAGLSPGSEGRALLVRSQVVDEIRDVRLIKEIWPGG